MARGKQIFVPQMGTIYPSAAAAASALGIDASNIGKVIRGKRLSAGGYSFVEVDPMASPETLKWIAEATAGRLTPKQQQRQARQRQKGFKRLSPEEQAAAKARARAAKELSRSLKEANKLLKQYQKEGLSGISSVVPELENLKAIIGKNKRGGFQADQKRLTEGFSQEQLEALKRQIDTQMNRKDFKDIEKAKQEFDYYLNQIQLIKEEHNKALMSLNNKQKVIEFLINNDKTLVSNNNFMVDAVNVSLSNIKYDKTNIVSNARVYVHTQTV